MLLGKMEGSLFRGEISFRFPNTVSVFRTAPNDRMRGDSFIDRKQPGRQRGLIFLMVSSNLLNINPHRIVLLALIGMKAIALQRNQQCLRSCIKGV